MQHPSDILNEWLTITKTDPIRPLLLRYELQAVMERKFNEPEKPRVVNQKKTYKITITIEEL